MTHMLVHFAVLTGLVLLLAYVLPGVRVNSTKGAALVAMVFGGLNWATGGIVAWLLRGVLFIPAILTFGVAWLLVPFLVNVTLLWLTDKLLDAFELRDGRTLMIAAAVITVANGVLRYVGG
jgi:putative membrane protein